MILRFQSKNGQFRLNLEATADIAGILPQVLEHLPKDVKPDSVRMSPQPTGKDSRPIASLRGVTFQRLGMT